MKTRYIALLLVCLAGVSTGQAQEAAADAGVHFTKGSTVSFDANGKMIQSRDTAAYWHGHPGKLFTAAFSEKGSEKASRGSIPRGHRVDRARDHYKFRFRSEGHKNFDRCGSVASRHVIQDRQECADSRHRRPRDPATSRLRRTLHWQSRSRGQIGLLL